MALQDLSILGSCGVLIAAAAARPAAGATAGALLESPLFAALALLTMVGAQAGGWEGVPTGGVRAAAHEKTQRVGCLCCAVQVERLASAVSEMVIERDWVPQLTGALATAAVTCALRGKPCSQ